jgi:hypothetical protein
MGQVRNTVPLDVKTPDESPPDSLRAKMKYTISEDATGRESERHKLLFMALENGYRMGPSRNSS